MITLDAHRDTAYEFTADILWSVGDAYDMRAISNALIDELAGGGLLQFSIDEFWDIARRYAIDPRITQYNVLAMLIQDHEVIQELTIPYGNGISRLVDAKALAACMIASNWKIISVREDRERTY